MQSLFCEFNPCLMSCRLDEVTKSLCFTRETEYCTHFHYQTKYCFYYISVTMGYFILSHIMYCITIYIWSSPLWYCVTQCLGITHPFIASLPCSLYKSIGQSYSLLHEFLYARRLKLEFLSSITSSYDTKIYSTTNVLFTSFCHR